VLALWFCQLRSLKAKQYAPIAFDSSSSGHSLTALAKLQNSQETRHGVTEAIRKTGKEDHFSPRLRYLNKLGKALL